MVSIGGKQLKNPGMAVLIIGIIMAIFLICAMGVDLICLTSNGYWNNTYGGYTSCVKPFDVDSRSSSGFASIIKAYAAFCMISFWMTVIVCVFAVLNMIGQGPLGPIQFTPKVLMILLIINLIFLTVAWPLGIGSLDGKLCTNCSKASAVFKLDASPFLALVAWVLDIVALVVTCCMGGGGGGLLGMILGGGSGTAGEMTKAPQQILSVDSALLITRAVVKSPAADNVKDYFSVWRRVESGTYTKNEP